MALEFIPYGKLADGKFGILTDNATGKPLASAVEILTVLPAVASADNYQGRLVFETTSQTLFVFEVTPAALWFPLEGIPATVGNFAGDPTPFVPSPEAGFLAYDLDTEVAFIFDGLAWQAIGGRFAAQFIQQNIIGDGVTFSFPHGATAATPVTNELCEVFLDGVRQESPADYVVVGPNVVLVVPPAVLVRIFIRCATSNEIAQNAQVFSTTFTAAAAQDTFSTGQAGLDPAGTFVFINGVMQASGGVDYTHSAVDTTILTLTRSGTTALATTLVPHNAGVGNVVEIEGVLQTEYLGTFTITGIPAANQFEFTIVVTAPTPAIPDPTMFYIPPFVNDDIIFGTPLTGGETVLIRSIKSVVSAPQAGEANTASNLGGGEGVFSTKSGVDLRFKSLVAGGNITLTDLGNELSITAATGAVFEDRNGTNLAAISLGSESYIGVRDTSGVVIVDLSTVTDVTDSGRRIVVQDESGGAGINNINIVHAGRTFSGAASPLLITSNFGSFTLVFDGQDWHISAQI